MRVTDVPASFFARELRVNPNVTTGGYIAHDSTSLVLGHGATAQEARDDYMQTLDELIIWLEKGEYNSPEFTTWKQQMWSAFGWED